MHERTPAKPGNDYPIQVHVSGIHIRTHCGSIIKSGNDVLYADVTLKGKKVDLMGEIVPRRLHCPARQESACDRPAGVRPEIRGAFPRQHLLAMHGSLVFGMIGLTCGESSHGASLASGLCRALCRLIVIF